MTVTFFDRDDDANHLNGTVIRDNSRLFQILQSMQDRLPFFCELVGENGFCLLIGVGKIGCAQIRRCDGRTPYLMAVSTNAEPKEKYNPFLIGGTSTPVSARFCMPFNTVMEIAGHFQETGGTYPAVSWEEI